MKKECILCGQEFDGKKNQYFCSDCRKEYNENYLYTVSKIHKGDYNKQDADNIIEKFEKGLFKKEISEDLGIRINNISEIVQYFYPNYEFSFRKNIRRKVKSNWNINKQLDYEKDLKKRAYFLNDNLVRDTDICLMLGIKYEDLKDYDLNNTVNKDKSAYPFQYQNQDGKWYYFNFIGPKKIILCDWDYESLINTIEENDLKVGNILYNEENTNEE